ncbi:hypothetical protein MRB53_032654 [Persea americana]|uniref:Uncharacterized protein n=1 Tax=Persea americana TaxID=3435 RepID=A0ACC2KSG4_PERAE|nr:hypothetical protein MRB53_032654 [Persea americana]
MRRGKTKPTEKEAAFKAHKKNKQVAQPDEEDSDDELTTDFVRKLRKGKGKFKGNLPFKCFNCGGIGHFAAKCPLANANEDDSDSYKSNKDYSLKSYVKKGKSKSYISKRTESSSENSSNENYEESNEVLFMAVLDDEKEKEKSDNEEMETEINLEEELIVALEQLSTERKKNKNISKKMTETEEIIETLKLEIEEGRKIKEELESQVIIKTKECSIMEEEITGLKAQVDKTNKKLKAYEGSIKLNEILNNQRPSHIKFGLGFEKGVERIDVKFEEQVEQPENSRQELPVYADDNDDNEPIAQSDDREEGESKDHSDKKRENSRWHEYHGIKETNIFGDAKHLRLLFFNQSDPAWVPSIRSEPLIFLQSSTPVLILSSPTCLRLGSNGTSAPIFSAAGDGEGQRRIWDLFSAASSPAKST